MGSASVTVRLTRAQADSLAAMNAAGRLAANATRDISGYDNSGSGTGGRLAALERKGLLTRGRLVSRHVGYEWFCTPLGFAVATVVEANDALFRAAHRRAGGEAFGVAFDLSGEYVIESEEMTT